MQYVSTRGAAPVLGFEGAMRAGLARDGGLYVPDVVPVLSPDAIAALAGLSYEDTAFRILAPFAGDAFAPETLARLIRDAYAGFGHPARAPLRQIAPGHHLLELFHGPTLAFKDFAMQLIGAMFAEVLGRTGDRVTIVGATSGDTGSAAIEAFRGRPGTDVFILYPHGRISEVQRRQMTTPAEANVHALALDGDFDDAQALVKALFNDHAFRDAVALAGVNSINWARVMAQVVYYFAAAVALGAPHRAVSFTVPTGNFGDAYAARIARRMGLPIARIVIATNRNDIVHRTLETGAYTRAGVAPTISPSMDIEVASNFERALFDAYGRDGGAVGRAMGELRATGGFAVGQGALGTLRDSFASGMATEAETSATIARVHREAGETVCPHTAVGVTVAERNLSDTPMVTLATAHPAKFPDAVEAATGQRPALPRRLADLFDRPERLTRVPNDLGTIQSLIHERIAP